MTSSPHLLSLWQISGLTAGSEAGEKEKEPFLHGLWKFPISQTTTGVACFSHSVLQKGDTPGNQPISYHPHQDAVVTGIHLHPLEINPHPFPSCMPRGSHPGAVSRDRQAAVVVHRQMQIPGRQLEVLPRQCRAEPGALAVFLRHLVPSSLH